jgi:hypothetical protein
MVCRKILYADVDETPPSPCTPALALKRQDKEAVHWLADDARGLDGPRVSGCPDPAKPLGKVR